MKYRRVGTSELVVSEISLGSWLTLGGGIDKNTAVASIWRALDVGVNFFDTANVYGRGTAELVLGNALAGLPRSSYVLASKLYFPMSAVDYGLSAAQVHKQLDASLRRLKVEYLDLYQCHRFDPEVRVEETLVALSEEVRAGKIRYLGFSEWPIDKIREALSISGVERFVSSQPQYSLIWSNPSKELIPFCNLNGISQIAFSPLAQGILTGKYRNNWEFDGDTRAGSGSMGSLFPRKWLTPALLRSVAECEKFALSQGLTLAEFALAWVLINPNIASAITGASRPEQIQMNARASYLHLSNEAFSIADQIMAPARIGLEWP